MQDTGHTHTQTPTENLKMTIEGLPKSFITIDNYMKLILTTTNIENIEDICCMAVELQIQRK